MKIHPLISTLHLPLYEGVPAGFPSPADDYLQKALDLNEHLIKRPSATYFVRVQGDSMTGAGIYDGDLLIVDRSLTPGHGEIVIAALNGELTCKALDRHRRQLVAANPEYPPIPVDNMELVIEGVVIASIRYHRCSH